MSYELNKRPRTIKNHILNLKGDIIKKYKILMNYNKMGYIWSLCILNISKEEGIKSLLKDLKSERRVPFISISLNKGIILDFISKDYSELKIFLEELKASNKEIEECKTLNIDKIHKIEEAETYSR